MNIDDERKAMETQLTYLTNTITSLEAMMPNASEMAYLRSRKLADENAAWAWRLIKTYTPWVATGVSVIGGGIYWLLTHAITITGPK